MQIHYALAHAPQWRGQGLDNVALLHLTPGLDGVSKAANEAERGILPSEPTICVGQLCRAVTNQAIGAPANC